MNGRKCHGSGGLPAIRHLERNRGKCRACGGWYRLSPGGRMHPHAYKVGAARAAA